MLTTAAARAASGQFSAGSVLQQPKRATSQCCACGKHVPVTELKNVPVVSTVPGKQIASRAKRSALLLSLGVRSDGGGRYRYCKAHETPGGIVVARPKDPPKLTAQQVTSYFGNATPASRAAANHTAFRRLHAEKEAMAQQLQAAEASNAILTEQLEEAECMVEALSYAMLVCLDDHKGGESCRSIVGMPSRGLEKALLSCEICHFAKIWETQRFKNKKNAPPWKTCVCMMLMKIKQFPSDAVIASRFGLVTEGDNGASTALVGIIWTACLPGYVYMLTMTVARQCGYQDVDRFRNKYFKENGWHCIYSVEDMTTFPCQQQRDPFCQSLTFSSYKHRHGGVFNTTMGPDLLPLHATPAFGARFGDADVIAAPASEYVSRLIEPPPGVKGATMGDKGTKIRKLCNDAGRDYYEPPFVHDGELTALEVSQSEKVAKPRSHVERVIQFPRSHKMLHTGVPSAYFPYLDDVIKIAVFNIHFTPFVKEMRTAEYDGSDDDESGSDD